VSPLIHAKRKIRRTQDREEIVPIQSNAHWFREHAATVMRLMMLGPDLWSVVADLCCDQEFFTGLWAVRRVAPILSSRSSQL